MKRYETAPVHPDFAPPSRGLWEWVAVLEMPQNEIVAMAANPARALQIVTALQYLEAQGERARVKAEHGPDCTCSFCMYS